MHSIRIKNKNTRGMMLAIKRECSSPLTKDLIGLRCMGKDKA
jgi:hypothetical protein